MVEEQLVDEDSEDTYLLSKVSDVIHALFSTYKESFFPFFDQIVGHYTKMLVSTHFSLSLKVRCQNLILISLN